MSDVPSLDFRMLSLVALLTSGSTFATSFTTLFSPIGSGEYDLTARHPQAEVTVNNIGQYQQLMEDLRGMLRWTRPVDS